MSSIWINRPTFSAWFSLFTLFVGGAMVWFAATGFCVMANALYWLGAELCLTRETMLLQAVVWNAGWPVCV
jgi:hypothetical protein